LQECWFSSASFSRRRPPREFAEWGRYRCSGDSLATRAVNTRGPGKTGHAERIVIHYSSMAQADVARFTVGVFQDIEWARKGLGALRQEGLPPESLSILAKESLEAAALIEQMLGAAGEVVEVAGVGRVLARGTLIGALQGSTADLPKLGIAGTMRRVGFQSHDGRIFETLTARGGVLVAIDSEPLAADSLKILHSYGGGNAAIGAWAGRV